MNTIRWLLRKVYWTFRAILWGFPLIQTRKEHYLPNTDDMEKLMGHLKRVCKSWQYMGPYFTSRGYILYQRDLRRSLLIPASSPKAATELAFPYGRRFYTLDQDSTFVMVSNFVWAARDTFGRDVVIKLISDSSSPTGELKVLRYLNTEPVRSDPRNHTIHVIEFLTFENLVFAVMPRWDDAFVADFETVEELMHCSENLLEALDFLHEHRIFHGDFLDQNTSMNAIFDSSFIYRPPYLPRDTRVSCDVRYAIIDFGNSSIYSQELALEDIRESKFFNFDLRGLAPANGPYNPFQVDVISVGLTLQRYVRHLENIIPELGPFFDGMVNLDTERRFTASQALAEFRRIMAQLSPFQLAQEHDTIYWNKGIIEMKAQYRPGLLQPRVPEHETSSET